MSKICPPRHLNEWKKLEKAVGRTEAIRDWKETKGEVRTPEEVNRKIAERTAGIQEKKKTPIVPIKNDKLSLFKREIKFGPKVTDLRKNMILKRLKAVNAKLSKELGREVKFGIKITRTAKMDLNELKIIDYRPDPIELEKTEPYIESKEVEERFDLGFLREDLDIKLDPNSNEETQALEIVRKLSEKLNVPHIIDSDSTAFKATNGVWKGEAGFYTDNQVHLVKGKITTKSVFHEFSHPVIRAILRDNPKIGKILLDKLTKSKEGPEILDAVRKYYTKENGAHSKMYEEGSPQFVEEVLVRGLTRDALNITKSEKASSGFVKFIKDLLYAIKQKLRQLFGVNTKVENLHSNTGLKDLAEILVKTGKFELSKDHVTEKDIAFYRQHTKEDINRVEELKKGTVLEMIDLIDKDTSFWINMLKKNPKYVEPANLVGIEGGELEQIREAVRNYKTNGDKEVFQRKLALLEEQSHRVSSQASALLTSLGLIQDAGIKIEKDLKELTKNINDKDNGSQILYYKNFINSWIDTTNGLMHLADRDNLSTLHPFYKTLSDNKNLLEANERIIHNVFKGVVEGTMNKQLKNSAESKHRIYEGKRREYIDKGASDKLLKELDENYEHDRLDPERVKEIVNGLAGDNNYINSFIEGFMSNTDPAVASLADYVDRQITDYITKFQVDVNTFKKEINPLLESAKWNRGQVDSLAKRLTFENEQYIDDPDTGLPTRQKVLTYLNPFKNIDADRVEKRLEITNLKEKARENNDSQDSETWDVIRQKEAEFDQWKTDYENRPFIPEFYIAKNFLRSTSLGRKVLDEMDDIYAERESYKSAFDDNGFSDYEQTATWKGLDSKFKQIANEYYPNGVKKEGEELKKAKLAKEYKKIRGNLYEYIPKTNAFANARKRYQQSLAIDGITKNDPNPDIVDDYNLKMNAWDERNTRRKLRDDPAKKIKQLTDRLRELNSQIKPEYREKVDLVPLFDAINDIEKQHKDSDWQTDGSELSPGETEVLKKSQEVIVRKRRAYGKQRLDLTPAESAEYDLKNKILSDLRSRYPTEYYVEAFNGFLNNFNGKQINTDAMFKLTGSRMMTRDTAEKITNSDVVIKGMKAESAEFKKWFENNHIEKKIYDTVADDGSLVDVWERLYAWSTVEMKDPKAYENTPVYDEEGNLEKVLEGAPIIKYYKTEVRNEYYNGYNRETGEIVHEVGVHKDNRGRWLPLLPEHGAKTKTYINQDYFDLKESSRAEDKATYKLLEYLKKDSLKDQERVDEGGRLWYDVPRFQKIAMEVIQEGGLQKKAASAFDQFKASIKKNAADQERGYNAKIDNGLDVTAQNVVDKENLKILNTQRGNTALDLRLAQVGGTYRLSINEVSRDLIGAHLSYKMNTLHNEKRKEMLPTIKAFQEVFSGDIANANETLQTINKKQLKNQTIVSKGDKTTRAKSIDYIFNNVEQGRMIVGPGADSKIFNAVWGATAGISAKSFFALEIPGALQNMFGPLFQGVTEAVAGKYINFTDLGLGIMWAIKASTKRSFELYDTDTKSLDVQLIESSDMIASTAESSLERSMSRTVGRDAIGIIGVMMQFRKFTESLSTIALAAAYKNHIKLTQHMPDGTKKQVSYLEAWELDKNGKIKLKDGIDPEYGNRPVEHTVILGDTVEKLAEQYYTTAERIKELNTIKGELKLGETIKISNADKHAESKKAFHSFSRANQGAYANTIMEKSQLDSHTLGRMVTYLKKFFLPMAMDRWAFKGTLLNPKTRLNIGSGEEKGGTYITIMDHFVKSLREMNYKLLYTSSKYDNGITKRAYLKALTEVALVFGITATYQALFDWDPDDKYRYKKLKKKSGALPLPFVVEDPRYPFKLKGYLANHMLSLMMRIQNENNQFVPIPGLGLDNYTKLLDVKSYAFGPTLEAWEAWVEDASRMAMGNGAAYYKKASGPYIWQQKDMPKLYKHVLNTIGLTGTTADVNMKIKTMEQNTRYTGSRR